jgi:hypothetical protein
LSGSPFVLQGFLPVVGRGDVGRHDGGNGARSPGAIIVDESEFWDTLEFRACREMAGIAACRRHGLWCDGFIAETYSLDEDLPCIEGRAWIGKGETQEPWHFTLVLAPLAITTGSPDWAKLLPADDVTGWLSVDFDARRLVIEPAAAIPDVPG